MVDFLDPRYRLGPLPPADLKGIDEPLEVFAVEGYSERTPQAGHRARGLSD